jgi:hypothetical protein
MPQPLDRDVRLGPQHLQDKLAMSPNFGGLGFPILRGVTSPLARYSSTQRCAVRTATSGTTALTRTPSGPSSNAIVWVIPTTPYFDAA